jgi:predicted lipoprotein with Yx(FWY)xxD motif
MRGAEGPAKLSEGEPTMTEGDGRDSAGRDLAVGTSSQAVATGSTAAKWLTGHRWTPALIVLAVAGAVAALLALSLSGSSPVNVTGPSVRVGSSSLGKILVDSRGLTLYTYGHDKRNVSFCTDVCARVWPPATVSGTPTVATGVSRARLKTITRSDHQTQLVYSGHPLYTFSEDTRRGEMGGEGFLGVWFVVSPAGRPIKQPGAASPSGGY